MLTLHLDIPESVYAEYSEAAEKINQRFDKPAMRLEPKTLMAFALAGYDAELLCGKFELALRIARAEQDAVPNPVLN